MSLLLPPPLLQAAFQAGAEAVVMKVYSTLQKVSGARAHTRRWGGEEG